MRMRSKRQDVIRFFDRWKTIPTEHLHRHAAGKLREIELNHLRETGKIYDNEDRLVFVATKEGEHLGIIRKKKFESAAGESFEIFPHRDDAAHPPKQRRQILLLIFDVDRFEVVFGIDDDRQVQLLR